MSSARRSNGPRSAFRLAIASLACASALALCVACVRASAAQFEPHVVEQDAQSHEQEIDVPATVRDTGYSTDQTLVGNTRFAAYDVLLDSGTLPLAAWQVEIVDASGRAKLVAVEGGQHLAFAEPPHYDPRALTGSRIVLAAFSTDATLPEGSSRVARVHFAMEGAEELALQVRVIAAATSDGSTISVRAALVRS